jgi:hypothetical protein
MRSAQERIRPVLSQYDEGLTARLLSALTGLSPESVKKAAMLMPDVYVDRWTQNTKGGRYVPIFVKVPVPEDCPCPDQNPR